MYLCGPDKCLVSPSTFEWNAVCFVRILVKKRNSADNYRQADIMPLKDGIKALLRAYRLQGKLNEVVVVASWERVMGKTVAMKTQEVFVSKGKLFVRLTSAPLKHELVMAKTKVLELINAEVGEEVIREVVFL